MKAAPCHPLPNTRFEQKVTAAFQPNASPEERIKSVALPAEAVDNIRARLNQRCLAHVGQER